MIIYWLVAKHAAKEYVPLVAACGTIAVAALGWCVAGWIAHRNAVRQNTTNILFARFSQAPFGEAMHRFHATFGHDKTSLVTMENYSTLRADTDIEKVKGAAAAAYLLNYFEFISGGVLNGDLDAKVVRDNIRGVITYYYDRCEPLIRSANKSNSRTYEQLMKLRTHYREP